MTKNNACYVLSHRAIAQADKDEEVPEVASQGIIANAVTQTSEDYIGAKGGVPWGRYRTTKRKPPMNAVRYNCLDCCNEQPLEVRLCPVAGCALYPYRFGRSPAPEVKAIIPGVLRSMRLKCLDCATTAKLVKACWVEDCPLYHYRFGKNPARAGVGGIGGPKDTLFTGKGMGLTGLKILEE